VPDEGEGEGAGRYVERALSEGCFEFEFDGALSECYGLFLRACGGLMIGMFTRVFKDGIEVQGLDSCS
jgi:hypothetical protein